MRRLALALRVRPEEGRSAALLVALMLLVSAGGSIGGNGVDTLFFSRFGVRFLPQMYVALGGVMLLVALAVTVLLARVARERLFVALPLVLAAALAFERVIVGFGPRWIYPVIWLAMNVTGSLQALLAWGLAGLVYDTRQAKRLFPLLGAGGILGAVLGGLGTPPLVRAIHTENLLLVWAIGLVFAFMVSASLTGIRLRGANRRRQTRARRRVSVALEMQQGYRTVKASPFLRWTALGAAVFAVLLYSIAFPFAKAVTAYFPNEDSLAGFLGLFQGVSTALAFAVALLVANRLFARFGVMRMIVVFPGIYLAGFALLIVTSPFHLIVGFRLAQMVWLLGVFTSASQASFNVVSPARKDQVRVFMEGVPAQAGTVAAGILLLVGQETLSPRAMFAIGLAAATVALLVVLRAMRAYRAALVDALREGRPQVFFSDEQPFGGFQRDAVAVQAAVAGVSSPDRAVRRVSAEILGHLAAPEATEALVRALKDRDPPVRVAALRGLVRARATGALLEVAGRLRDPEPAVRLEAVNALRQLAPYRAGVARETRSLLTDEDPAVRSHAAATLLSFGPEPDAAHVLHSMARAEDGNVRMAAVSAVANARHSEATELAAAALADPLASVRRAAALSLGSLDPATSVPALVTALGDPAPSVRRAAVDALAAIGEPALEPTLSALEEPNLERGALEVLHRMPRVPPASVERYARGAATRALHYREGWRAADRAGGGDRMGLLADVLRSRALEHAERALRGAGLLSDRVATAVAIENLSSGDPAQRANALEILEAGGPRDLVAPLVSLWEPIEDGIEPADGWLLSALEDHDPWVRACAVSASREAVEGGPRHIFERLATSDSDPGVTEEARKILDGSSVDTLPTLSVIERVLLLRRVPLFGGLTPDDLKRLAEIATEQAFEPNEILAEEGDPGDETYLLFSGNVGVVIGHDRPDEREVARIGPGGHVGEMAVIGGGVRSASLVARDPVRALVLDRPHFESLLRERPDVGMALMRTLAERVRESNQLLPQELAARTEAGRATRPPDGERRVLTMLFCDVVDSTSMAERLDPEEWADVVEEAYAGLVEPVERYGGTLARFMGDAILAFFGAPTAHEDDAERAVRAGLEMIEAVGPLGERLAERELTFAVRIGINTGLVRVGDVGPDSRLTYTALGDAVNVAARMEQSAAPGTVQISEATARLVAPLFELEDLGAIQVKGKKESVGAYRVVGARSRPGKVRGIEGLASRLVGRDEELELLARAASDIGRGRGQVVSIVGEAGLGKSRLIEELRSRWDPNGDDGPRWIEARALSYDAARPYALAQQLVRGLCGAPEREAADRARERIARFIDEIGVVEPERSRAAFELLLGLDESDGSGDGSGRAWLPEGEEIKREVLAAVRRACQAWASSVPSVVVVDDLHWSDPASLELVLHLLSVVGEAPILFVCACRLDPPTLLGRIEAAMEAEPDRHTSIRLAPLQADETITLVAELLMLPEPPEELRRVVVDKAAGNPLFIEETLRALMDGGAVVREEGGWRIMELADVRIPDQLQGLLAARVDALEPAPRRTLQLASVIGRMFGYRVLKSICDDPDDLGDHLDKLERAGLIVETSEVPELEFGFRHPLLQEAAYRSMLIRHRRTYHGRVAEALEHDLAGREDLAATLAHHFDEAGDAERTLRYRTVAARRADRLHAHEEAIAQFERALQVAPEAGASVVEMSALYEGLGHSLQLSGQHERALRVYEEMEAKAQSLGDPAMELAAVTAMATVRSIPSEVQDADLALGLLDRSLELAVGLGDRAAEARAHWNRMLLMQFTMRDIDEAVEHGERALAIARELHLEDLLAFALHDIADSYYFLGRAENSWAAIEESRRLFERSGNDTMFADSIGREGHLLLVAGRYREALSPLDRALEIDRRIKSVWGESYALFVRRHVLWELGDLDASLADTERLAELAPSASQLIQIGARSDIAVMLGDLGAVARGFEQIQPALVIAPSFPHLRSWALGAQAHLLLLAGRLREAEEAARGARQALPPPGALVAFHMALRVALSDGEIAMARRDAQEALRVLSELEGYMAERRLGWGLGDIARLRALALKELGRPEEAWDVLAGLPPKLEEVGSRWALWRLLSTMADVAELQGRVGEALEIRGRARKILQSVAGTLTDPELAVSFAALPDVAQLLDEPQTI